MAQARVSMKGHEMSEHFNGLTPAEAERLAYLIEEAAEVQQIACKARDNFMGSNALDGQAVKPRDLCS